MRDTVNVVTSSSGLVAFGWGQRQREVRHVDIAPADDDAGLHDRHDFDKTDDRAAFPEDL